MTEARTADHLVNRSVHMNGRIYDPALGRMLSPDPVTQAPENGQNYNRYTYAFNNPLRYTDPSGYQSEFGDFNDDGFGDRRFNQGGLAITDFGSAGYDWFDASYRCSFGHLCTDFNNLHTTTPADIAFMDAQEYARDCTTTQYCGGALQHASVPVGKEGDSIDSTLGGLVDDTITLIPIGFGVSLVAGFGFEGAVQIVVTPGGWRDFDIGVAVSIGGGFGANVSADVFAGASRGNVFDMEGSSIDGNLPIGPVSGTIATSDLDLDGYPELNGATFGVGAALFRGGASISVVETRALSRQTVIRDLVDSLCRISSRCD